MLSLPLVVLVMDVAAATSAFAGVPDAQVIQGLAAFNGWNLDAAREIGSRLDTYPAQARRGLIDLLITTVEQSPDEHLQKGCAAELTSAAHYAPEGRDVIAAHMQRIILRGNPAQDIIVKWYIKVLVEFDHTEATHQAILSVFRNRALMSSDAEGTVETMAIHAMSRFGAQGEEFLLNYKHGDSADVAGALANNGGHKAFNFLVDHAKDRTEFYRALYTRTIGSWATQKTHNSSEWRRAAKALSGLACDRDQLVKDTALAGLSRIGATAPTTCDNTDNHNDEHDREDRDDEGDDHSGHHPHP